MATREDVLQALADVEHHVRLLTGATRPDEITQAAGDYLATWSKERIENLQKIDGGWGPFDTRQRQAAIHDLGHIARISDVLSNHCRALKDAGIEPTPELLELDLYFVLAKQMAENVIASGARFGSGTSRSTGYRHWSDSDALAA